MFVTSFYAYNLSIHLNGDRDEWALVSTARDGVQGEPSCYHPSTDFPTSLTMINLIILFACCSSVVVMLAAYKSLYFIYNSPSFLALLYYQLPFLLIA